MSYSAGDCPICADSGALLFGIALSTDQLFVFCPACGVAWKHPEQAMRVDTVYPVKRFAPNGFRFAKLPEIQEAGLEEFVVKEQDENV
jgi:hypothetical protein